MALLKQAAGWFIQDNWKGGLKTVREGLQKAIDLKIEVTWAQTIAKYMYMGVLLVHRGVTTAAAQEARPARAMGLDQCTRARSSC